MPTPASLAHGGGAPPPVGAGRVTAAVVGAAAVAACGGVLFGYDLGVTGGVTTDERFLEQFFPATAARIAAAEAAPSASPWCKYDDHLLTLFTSSCFLAAAVTTIGAGSFVRAAGRKAAIIAAGGAFLFGVGVTAGAVHVAMLVVGRLAIGVGTGLANTAVPIYLSEIAPTQARGLINILFQLATTGSILAAQLVNLALLPGRHAWRASVGLAMLPALGLTFGTLFLDDSPASLAARGRDGAGRAALQRLRGRGVDVAREWAVVQAAHATAQPAGWAQWRALGAARVRPELLVAVGVALGSQLNGINACLFFAAPVFSALVAPGRAALLSAVAIGFALFAPTLIAAALVDRVGRRPLLLIGGCVMFVAQVALAGVLGAGMGPGAGSVLSPGAARAALALMCAFVTAFALSWGPGGWLVPSEVFPLDVRAAGQAAATCANFLAVFVTTQTFLPSMCAMRYGIYLASAAAVALMTLGVFFFLPETRGVHIEAMDALWASHPVWRRWAAAKSVHGGGAVVSVGSTVQRRAKMSDDGGALG